MYTRVLRVGKGQRRRVTSQLEQQCGSSTFTWFTGYAPGTASSVGGKWLNAEEIQSTNKRRVQVPPDVKSESGKKCEQ